MPEGAHIHNWKTVGSSNKVSCMCNEVKDLNVVLRETIEQAKLQAKVELLTAQMFNKDLKKPAYERAYEWVLRNSPGVVAPIEISQGALL